MLTATSESGSIASGIASLSTDAPTATAAVVALYPLTAIDGLETAQIALLDGAISGLSDQAKRLPGELIVARGVEVTAAAVDRLKVLASPCPDKDFVAAHQPAAVLVDERERLPRARDRRRSDDRAATVVLRADEAPLELRLERHVRDLGGRRRDVAGRHAIRGARCTTTDHEKREQNRWEQSTHAIFGEHPPRHLVSRRS